MHVRCSRSVGATVAATRATVPRTRVTSCRDWPTSHGLPGRSPGSITAGVQQLRRIARSVAPTRAGRTRLLWRAARRVPVVSCSAIAAYLAPYPGAARPTLALVFRLCDPWSHDGHDDHSAQLRLLPALRRDLRQELRAVRTLRRPLKSGPRVALRLLVTRAWCRRRSRPSVLARAHGAPLSGNTGPDPACCSGRHAVADIRRDRPHPPPGRSPACRRPAAASPLNASRHIPRSAAPKEKPPPSEDE